MGRRWDCRRFRYAWLSEHCICVLERTRVSAKGSLRILLFLLTHYSDFLKERLFGLSNPQGNHGESIKEAHFHVDNTPTVRFLPLLGYLS